MSLKDIVNTIPVIFECFVPGFIFISIFKYFADVKNDNFTSTSVASVVLSFIFQAVSSIVCSFFQAEDVWVTGVTVMLSAVSSIVVVKIRLTKKFKEIVKLIGKTTGSKDIWYDFFDLDKGTKIRFFTEFNHQKVYIVGDVKYFETCKDSCNIIVENYIVTYCDSEKQYFPDKKSDDDEKAKSTLIFNTKDVHGLEAHYGK